MEKICDFFKKLDDNLKKSLSTYNNIALNLPKNKKCLSDAHLDELAVKMQSVSATIELYKEAISKLEDIYFSDDDKQFVLSVQKNLHGINVKCGEELNCVDSYKKSMTTQITKHKYSEVLTRTYPQCTEPVHDKNVHKTGTITLDNIEGVDLQKNFLELPIAETLESIPPAFYWYTGDKYHKSGIYISLCKDFHIKIPFPNLINLTKEFNSKSIKCKYETLTECQTNKKKIATIYGGEVKECFYVHKKEKFNKVGTPYRCAVETFGNHKLLNFDLKRVSNLDIKHLLMHSLSDDILAILWYQNKFKVRQKLVFTNLDTY